MKSGPIRVIRLAGELEIGRRDEIHTALQVRGDEPGILLDFAEVTYADSTTLAELLRFRADAERQEVPVAVVIESKQFARLIQYAGLRDAFAIFDSRGAALTHLSSARP